MDEFRPSPGPVPVLILLIALSAALAAPRAAATASGPGPAVAEEGGEGDHAAGAADPGAEANAAETAGAEAEEDAGEQAPEPPPPLWMDLYGEGVYSRHDDRNLAGFNEVKLGKRLNLLLPLDLYLKTRLYRDQRDFYWNNRADVGAGARIPLLKKVSLSLFGEVIAGQYLRLSSGTVSFEGMQARIERNRAAIDAAQKEFQGIYGDIFVANKTKDTTLLRETLIRLNANGKNYSQNHLDSLDAHLDGLETSKDSLYQVMDSLALVPAGALREYRAGLVFWYGWGQGSDQGPGPRFAFPFRFWGEVYSDCIFSSLSRHVRTRGAGETYRDSLARFRNLIFYANPDVGMVMMEGLAGSLSAYAAGYVWFDTHKDWWNNLAMAGPGLRYKPLGGLDLVFKAEYLWGRYHGRERGQDPNPYARDLRDLRIAGSFWYGVGI